LPLLPIRWHRRKRPANNLTPPTLNRKKAALSAGANSRQMLPSITDSDSRFLPNAQGLKFDMNRFRIAYRCA